MTGRTGVRNRGGAEPGAGLGTEAESGGCNSANMRATLSRDPGVVGKGDEGVSDPRVVGKGNEGVSTADSPSAKEPSTADVPSSKESSLGTGATRKEDGTGGIVAVSQSRFDFNDPLSLSFRSSSK